MKTPTPSKRPQLTLDELHQLKWLLGGVLTLLALGTVFYMDVEAWTLMVITTVGTGVCLVWPTLPARLPAVVHLLAFPAIVLFFVGDLWLTTEPLPAMVRLDIMLLLYRGISYRQRRDDLQVIVLGLFLIVVAGVLTVSLVFAAQLLIFTACALAFLLAVTLVHAAESGDAGKAESGKVKNVAPSWAVHADWPRLFRRLREVADWRVIALGVGLFTGVVVVSALLFLAIPRFQLENSLFLDRFISKKTKTGFNDSIRFGDVTEIQQDTSVALSVDVSDRSQVPASPYWRMLVLDQYENGAFRLSPPLRRAAFGNERTDTVVHGQARPRLGPAVYWTFYLESGVSRYLPLLGEFELLKFQEPQNFRLGATLGVLALRDEPATMTAYRAEGFNLSGALPDPTFPNRLRERAMEVRLNLSEADHATLTRIVGEITDGATSRDGGAAPAEDSAGEPQGLAPAAFLQRAKTWLQQNHGYSLSPNMPRGDGDPLVRWMASREAGHCELFAGSLVLLARTAGWPARVVTGFRGGTWNAYSNNFTIRNSDAHAWAEVFDSGTNTWLRADALEAPRAAAASEANGEAALARRLDRSWTARLDSLRMFWYRRIVNFDQRSQVETLKTVKEVAQNSGRRLKEALKEMFADVRTWVGGPWTVKRFVNLLGVIATAGLVVWVWRDFGHGWWRQFVRSAGGRREDPVRSDASRWLARFRAEAAGGRPAFAEAAAGKPEARGVVADLQRLRFGARETWPEPENVFRRARQAWRELRRHGRVTVP